VSLSKTSQVRFLKLTIEGSYAQMDSVLRWLRFISLGSRMRMLSRAAIN